MAFPLFNKQALESIISCRDLSAINLIEKMIHINPEKRISPADALNHEFFNVSILRSLAEKNPNVKKGGFRQSIDFKSKIMQKEPLSLNITDIQPSYRSVERRQEKKIDLEKIEDYTKITPFHPGVNLYDLLKPQTPNPKPQTPNPD